MEINELFEILLGCALLLNLGFMILMIPVGLYRRCLLEKKLRKLAPQEWERLGSPTMIMNNTLRNNALVGKWLWCKEYLRLDNQEIIKEARLGRILMIAYLISFTSTLILLVMLWPLPIAGKVGIIAAVIAIVTAYEFLPVWLVSKQDE